MFKLKSAGVALAIGVAGLVGSTANATIVTVFDGITAGMNSFNSTVTGAGSTVNTDVWTTLGSGTSIDRGDYTITHNSGASMTRRTRGALSGLAIRIDPTTSAPGGNNPRTDPMDYFGGGITMTFDNAVNAVAFEVEDWATCCFEPTTDLFISFDGGAPILVASATQRSDGEFPQQGNPSRLIDEIMVAAFDDTGSFTSVSFWGNGLGEILYAGGQVRYALLDQGTLPPSTVPLPAGGLLLMGAMGALGIARRKRRS